MAAMAIKIHPRIEEQAKIHNIIVLDGLYSWEEYLFLREKYPNIQLLCIYASPPIRHKRLSIRPVRPLTIRESESRDIAELQNLNKGGPIAFADYLIKNEGNENAFHTELEKYYSTIV
jgi:dephospho-CoA kinase